MSDRSDQPPYERPVTRRQALKVGGSVTLAAAFGSMLGGGVSKAAAAWAASSDTQLTLMHDKASWAPFFQAESDAASRAIGVSWKQNPINDTNVFKATLRPSLGTSSAPDLYTYFIGTQLADVAPYSIDISSIWDKEAAGFGKLKSLYSYKGKAYGVPLFYAPWVIYYNKHIFKKYKLSPPKTWTQFMTLLATLKSHKVAPLGMSTDWGAVYFWELLLHTNVDLYNKLMAGRAKYTDPQVVAVMNLWGSMIKKGYFTDPSTVHFGGPNGNNFANLFARQKVAMAAMATWYGPTMPALKPGVDYGAFIMPNVRRNSPNAVVIEGAPVLASNSSPHTADATKALAYWMSKDGYTAWVKASGLTSARADVPSSSPVDRAIVQTLVKGNYRTVNRIYEATPVDLAQTLTSECAKFMLNPRDPRPILKAVQKKADSVFG